MSFIEDLKSYLLRVQHSGSGQEAPSPVTLAPEWVRAELLSLFERLERESTESDASTHIAQLFVSWTEQGRALRFADNLATLLQDSFLRRAPREELEQYVRLAIARRIGLPERAPSLTRHLELERLSARAWGAALKDSSSDKWRHLPYYTSEIRAVRRINERLELTPIGNVLLSLTGRDAIHWMLHVEAAQSTGPSDDWRLSRATAAALLETPREVEPIGFWERSRFLHSWATLRRLSALQLLTVVDDDHTGDYGYELLDEGRQALEALVTPGGSPFSVLATTLSQDEALATLDDSTGHTLSEASLGSSALATALQARLVAHEIRNALIPAQFALNSLYGNLVGGEVEATVSRFRPRIDPGVDRVLKFVNDLLKTSELATRPPEGFDVLRALSDARASLATGLAVRVQAPESLPAVLGYRDRFVLAVVNLLRNAEQAGARHVELVALLEPDGQSLLLTVDDDGSGIPAEQRERIFQRGVSLRPGGSGEGLALVKEVIEFELRGKVACLEGPQGGARFRMRLPVLQRSP